MAKHILSILLSAFLMLILQEESDMRGQELQAEVESVTQNTQYSVLSHSCVLRPNVKRTTPRSDRFGRETPEPKIGECTQGHSTYFRCRIVPFKILKNDVIVVGQGDNFADMQLSVNNFRNRSNNVSCLKFYHQHYIYTIEHILI